MKKDTLNDNPVSVEELILKLIGFNSTDKLKLTIENGDRQLVITTHKDGGSFNETVCVFLKPPGLEKSLTSRKMLTLEPLQGQVSVNELVAQLLNLNKNHHLSVTLKDGVLLLTAGELVSPNTGLMLEFYSPLWVFNL